MLSIKTFTSSLMGENCYVVWDQETLQAAVIDPGTYYDEERSSLLRFIDTSLLKPEHLLLTHGHFDHIFGLDAIDRAYCLKPEIHRDDLWLLEDADSQMRELAGLPYPFQVPRPSRLLDDSDIITLGSHQLKVIHTPGHTPGSVVFYEQEERMAFSGDTLFRMSIGRTDLRRGSYEQIRQSLKHLKSALQPDTTVYCGHGPSTTIADECAYNPYIS